jgi:ribosomal protein S5
LRVSLENRCTVEMALAGRNNTCAQRVVLAAVRGTEVVGMGGARRVVVAIGVVDVAAAHRVRDEHT